MKTNIYFNMLMAGAGCLLTAAGTMVYAAGTTAPADMVKYRQSLMLTQRGHMAAAAAIIKGEVNFPEQLPVHVNSLAATTQDIASMFPAGSDVDDTKAKPDVWKDPEEFGKRAKDTQKKSAALAQAVSAGESAKYGQLFKDLLDSCKSCHKDFRKKEEK
jgi:cytochrome c556